MEYEGSFTPHDHTLLIQALLSRPLHVFKYLDVSPGDTPTAKQLVDAALRVEAFDTATKRRLEAAKAAGEWFEETRAANGELFDGRQQRVRAALDGRSVPEMIVALDGLLDDSGLEDDSAAGIALARDILIDGAGTIYSPFDPSTEIIADLPAVAAVEADTPHQTGAQHVAQVDAEAAATAGGSPQAGAAAGLISGAQVLVTIYEAFFV
jgi:hypothetical protein